MGLLDRFRRPRPQPTTDVAKVREFFLEAAADEEHYPAVIDPRIQHVRLLLEHLGPLGTGRAADIGSGKGRFARIVQERHPDATILALDLAESMLAHVAAPIVRVAASMTQIPLASESLDAAWAFESLEHAVDIRAAVGELTRILKPGGRLAIIDKNARHWGKLETPEWEQWFDRSGLERQLRRHCREVSSREVSYWDDVQPDGLFLGWFAVK